MVTNINTDSSDVKLRHDRWTGAAAGALAALVALAVVVVLKEITGIVSILDALAEVILSFIPVGLFSALIGIFGTSAKAWLFVGIATTLILIAAGAGWLFVYPDVDSPRSNWRTGLSFGAVALATFSLFMLWAVDLRAGSILTYVQLAKVLLCVVAASLAFAVALSLSLSLLRTSRVPAADRAPADGSRRRLLETAGLGLAGIASVVILGREVKRVRSGEAVVASGGKLPEPITPNDEFYIVSKNFVDPRVDTGNRNWTIRIDGNVSKPRSFSAADLQSLASPDFVSTLTCISNPVGGPLISTAVWTGAPLAEVLNHIGLDPQATTVVFHGSDGYTDSLPLAKATAPTTMLVWAMNGQPLPRKHGFPARVIVPGRYGIKNVKWLERIEVIRGDYSGYWQQKGWTKLGEVKTESQIRLPGDKAIVHANDAELAGLAFAGDRGVSKVEVSLDGGRTWQMAVITDNPSPQNLSWVLWRLPWRPAPGTYSLLVRATDGTGALQTSDKASPLPDGASGWHHIVVGVAG
jgi:DMSO/TMAO reductase YedYZ molybdopterin-dependent catalytic subunit